ncbi:hypothetical protein G7Y89_g3288 [Cudoniella acicularis]|uniref:Carboxylesterase type B domain-containing protein n=1 Tax=Cudoniella acicularis TaxID=354080 RepID=A0A8H4W7T5_9HELO|nr:hypothetical protein G7Y89_g3288 [Cudoniella acicularis]
MPPRRRGSLKRKSHSRPITKIHTELKATPNALERHKKMRKFVLDRFSEWFKDPVNKLDRFEAKYFLDNMESIAMKIPRDERLNTLEWFDELEVLCISKTSGVSLLKAPSDLKWLCGKENEWDAWGPDRYESSKAVIDRGLMARFFEAAQELRAIQVNFKYFYRGAYKTPYLEAFFEAKELKLETFNLVGKLSWAEPEELDVSGDDKNEIPYKWTKQLPHNCKDASQEQKDGSKYVREDEAAAVFMLKNIMAKSFSVRKAKGFEFLVYRHKKCNALPVLVWIYGGGLYAGSSADPQYNVSGIAHVGQEIGKPVIVASINYRLGVWGFLQTPQILAEGNSNAGLLDQRLALRWIKENIADFGGDADRITIWGESAGAQSIGLHLHSYDGRDDGLFHAAIMESGSQIGAALQPLAYYTNGDFLTAYPSTLTAAGKFIHIPLLIGANSDEGTSFGVSGLDNATAIFNNLLIYRNYAISPPIARKLLELYPNNPESEPPYYITNSTIFPSKGLQWRRDCAIAGDIVMISGRRKVCEEYAKARMDVFSYRFDTPLWNAEVTAGAQHFVNVVFSFQNISGALGPLPEYQNYTNLSHNIGKSYISFVNDQDPNTSRANSTMPYWPKYALNAPKNMTGPLSAGIASRTSLRTRSLTLSSEFTFAWIMESTSEVLQAHEYASASTQNLIAESGTDQNQVDFTQGYGSFYFGPRRDDEIRPRSATANWRVRWDQSKEDVIKADEASGTEDPEPFPFMRLPLEIRLKIYYILLSRLHGGHNEDLPKMARSHGIRFKVADGEFEAPSVLSERGWDTFTDEPYYLNFDETSEQDFEERSDVSGNEDHDEWHEEAKQDCLEIAEDGGYSFDSRTGQTPYLGSINPLEEIAENYIHVQSKSSH